MYYKKYYTLNWTWKYVGGTYCYSEYKVFDTQEDLDKSILEVLGNCDIEVVWCKKTFEEVWEKKNNT